MNTRNLPAGRGLPACKADNLTAICELTIYNACYRASFAYAAYCLSNTFLWVPQLTMGERCVLNEIRMEILDPISCLKRNLIISH
jgi:hypothetical protein